VIVGFGGGMLIASSMIFCLAVTSRALDPRLAMALGLAGGLVVSYLLLRGETRIVD
jgi:hypothetical protein